MYRSPIPVDKDKQCYDCKSYEYDGSCDISHCVAGHGSGEWSVVDAVGTCENWERVKIYEFRNPQTSL